MAHDSFKKDTLKPRIIHGAINNNEKVTNLIFNNKNELHLGLHDVAASLVKIKKMTNNTLRTIFSRPGNYILVKPVDNGTVIKTITETIYQRNESFTLTKDVNNGGVNKTATETIHRIFTNFGYDIELMYLEENDMLISLSYYYIYKTEKQRQLVISNAFRGNNALSDKQGNLFFESEDPDPNHTEKPQLFFLNITTREILDIPLPDEINEFQVDHKKIMLDKIENVWIWPHDEIGSKNQFLYCLKKGSLIPKKILDNLLVWKRKGDDIFFGSGKGLFVKSFET